MTEKDTKIDGRARRAADIALAKRQISPASYRALVEEGGRITLQQAKELGRDRGPDGAIQGHGDQETATETVGRTSAEDGIERAPCLCGCGQAPKGKKARFLMGHDNRLFGELKRNLRSDPLLRNARFTDEQREYARERGLLR